MVRIQEIRQTLIGELLLSKSIQDLKKVIESAEMALIQESISMSDREVFWESIQGNLSVLVSHSDPIALNEMRMEAELLLRNLLQKE